MLQEIVLFGKTINLYSVFNTLGNICIFIWALSHLKLYSEFSTFSNVACALTDNKKKNSLSRWFFALIEVSFILAVLLVSGNLVGKELSSIFLGDISNDFFANIIYVPIGLFAFGVLLRISPLKLLDYPVPGVLIALIFYKIACFCNGCCFGVFSEHGMFNHLNSRKEFPVQLLEAGCAVVMLIVLLILWRKKGRKPGILYPIFMIMYCILRFISEFWRGDYPDVLGALNGNQLLCIVGFVEGIILLVAVLKFGDKITAFYDAKRAAVLDYITQKSDDEKN